MKAFFFSILIIIVFTGICCKKKTVTPLIIPPPVDTMPVTDTTPLVTNTSFAKGADVSWITQMEASGIHFYDTNGVQKDIYQILKNKGINAIRLREWVNPADGYNSTADVVAKAIRAKNAGMKIMIDFHYSDTWTDPGHQMEPAAWAGKDISVLQDSLYNHTLAVLNTLKSKNIIPDWVQVGNETNDGMLWPAGQASVSMQNFAALVTSGYNAVKAVDSSIKVIVHISNGYDNNLFRYVFDGLVTNNAKWDIIGMSLYPSSINWATLNTQCLANMNNMVSRYNKKVMICEIGMSWTDSVACKSFITDIIAKTKSVNNNEGLGVFYWEPEAYNNWSGYTLGAFNNAGMPTSAMDAFGN